MTHPLQALEPLAASDYATLRRRALLEGCKWDAQVGDVQVLAPFPLRMNTRSWTQLAAWAEALSAEAERAELEALAAPELLSCLGFPRSLRKVLTADAPLTPAAGRITRFDFHWTETGWHISEANSDVPGGYSESSYFTARMAEHFPTLTPAGDPGRTWSAALVRAIAPGNAIALLSAPGHMEDHQVVAYLAAELRKRGVLAFLARPEQLVWRDGVARIVTASYDGALHAIVRFYQAEWLARLPEASGWSQLFRGGATLVANPAAAVISESKRFPLIWDQLETELPTWRALLPRTFEPRRASRSESPGFVLKTAMSNNGDGVVGPENPREWRRARFHARLRPGTWLAQQRFESLPLPTPLGPRHACIGVYTVNGAAAGAYARLSEGPVVDYSAVDAALLIEPDE